jgi:hypothetical protein
MPGFKIGGTGDGPTNTPNPLMNYRWLITELGPVGRGGQLLQFAKDVTLPNMRMERQEILGGLVWYKFAKAVRWDDAEIVFYDTGDLLPKLQEWQDMVFKLDKGIQKHSPSGGYKMVCSVDLLDGNGEVVNTHKLMNAWPVSINQGKMTYTNSEIKLVTLTLSYDYALSTKN